MRVFLQRTKRKTARVRTQDFLKKNNLKVTVEEVEEKEEEKPEKEKYEVQKKELVEQVQR